MDAVGADDASLAGDRRRGLLVVRSLTKHWSIPGIRAGYVLGNDRAIAGLGAKQIPGRSRPRRSRPPLPAPVGRRGPKELAGPGDWRSGGPR